MFAPNQVARDLLLGSVATRAVSTSAGKKCGQPHSPSSGTAAGGDDIFDEPGSAGATSTGGRGECCLYGFDVPLDCPSTGSIRAVTKFTQKSTAGDTPPRPIAASWRTDNGAQCHRQSIRSAETSALRPNGGRLVNGLTWAADK
jgi:hypothetical protein